MKKIYDPKVNGQMRVIGFMSGSGSNIRRLIEHERSYASEAPYKFVALFADTEDCNVRKIGNDFGLPVFVNDLEAFCAEKGRPVKDMETRRLYDSITRRSLFDFNAHAIALGGYMRKITEPLLNNYICVNVHPADLSKVDASGKRIFTGDKAVAKALRFGERELRSTVHLADEEPDRGPILMISDAVKVEEDASSFRDESFLEERAKHYQDLLKERGDLVIFPLVLDALARGRYSIGDDKIAQLD